MSDFYYCENITNSRRICVSPLAHEQIESGSNMPDFDDSGIFIYELDSTDPSASPRILAKLESDEHIGMFAEFIRAYVESFASGSRLLRAV